MREIFIILWNNLELPDLLKAALLKKELEAAGLSARYSYIGYEWSSAGMTVVRTVLGKFAATPIYILNWRGVGIGVEEVGEAREKLAAVLDSERLATEARALPDDSGDMDYRLQEGFTEYKEWVSTPDDADLSDEERRGPGDEFMQLVEDLSGM